MREGKENPAIRSASIKKYIVETFVQEGEHLQKARESANQAGLPHIEVPGNVGKLLYMLSKLHKPKRVLEIGTLAGYSTLWLARSLDEDGHITTIDCNPEHIACAKTNIEASGFSSQVTLLQGLASETLKNLEGPFDFIFIDADKENYPIYLHWAMKLSKKGTLIVADNLIPKEAQIGSPDPLDQEACGIYQYNKLIAESPHLESIIVPTIVGEKGRIDGIGVSIVL